MATLNEMICAVNLKNTGFGECVIDPAEIFGSIRVPKGKVFTLAELADLRNTLDAASMAPSKADRIFPIHNYLNTTDNSEDVVFETIGATQFPIRDGHYRLTFQYRDGALCLSNSLQTHNFQSSYWIHYDKNFMLLGWRKLDATGLTYGLAGIPSVFHAHKWKVATPTTAANYSVYFDFDPVYFNKYLGFYQADFPLSEIVGLRNVNLVQSGASAAGVVKLLAKTGCDGANMYDQYSTQLGAGAVWAAINATTGATITITSAAIDANIKGFTITLSSADPDYPATTGGLVTINLVDPVALDTAGVSGFEGIPITVLRG